MSLTYGFYDSVNHDRKYNAKQFSAMFDNLITDGVFSSVGGFFSTSPGTGMSVIIAPGRAWFNHTWTYNDANYSIPISQSEIGLSRIDAIVLEVNNEDAIRENSIKAIKGVPASSPVAPTIVDSENVHQHPLAYVLVRPQVTSISSSDITVVVGTSETPFVTGILETVDIESLFASWQQQFYDWFENVQYVLSDDAAGHLQVEIDNIAKSGFVKTEEFTSAGTRIWVPSAKQRLAIFVLVGAGGGGGGGRYAVEGNPKRGAGGGGGGEVVISGIVTLSAGDSVRMVIGAGGSGGNGGTRSTGGALSGSNGSNGGSTACLGMVAIGGSGGQGRSSVSSSGNGGAGGRSEGYAGNSAISEYGAVHIRGAAGAGGAVFNNNQRTEELGENGIGTLQVYPFPNFSAGGGGGGYCMSGVGETSAGTLGGVSAAGLGGFGGDGGYNEASLNPRGGAGANGSGGGGGGSVYALALPQVTQNNDGGNGGDGYIAVYTLDWGGNI